MSRIPRADESKLNLQTVLQNKLYENDPIYGPEIINKFKNQLIMYVSNDPRKSSHIFYSVFSDTSRHIFHRKEYSEDDLRNILTSYLSPTIYNGYLLPQSLQNCAQTF